MGAHSRCNSESSCDGVSEPINDAWFKSHPGVVQLGKYPLITSGDFLHGWKACVKVNKGCTNKYECTWMATGCPNMPAPEWSGWAWYMKQPDAEVWSDMYHGYCDHDKDGSFDSNNAHRKKECCGDDTQC